MSVWWCDYDSLWWWLVTSHSTLTLSLKIENKLKRKIKVRNKTKFTLCNSDSYRHQLSWSVVSAFLSCFLSMRRTWPTLLVNWCLVTFRPVMDWANSESLYAYRIFLHFIYTNSSSLVGLNICDLAGCICSLIHADYL